MSCTAGCGFHGSPAFGGKCSVCFKKEATPETVGKEIKLKEELTALVTTIKQQHENGANLEAWLEILVKGTEKEAVIVPISNQRKLWSGYGNPLGAFNDWGVGTENPHYAHNGLLFSFEKGFENLPAPQEARNTEIEVSLMIKLGDHAPCCILQKTCNRNSDENESNLLDWPAGKLSLTPPPNIVVEFRTNDAFFESYTTLKQTYGYVQMIMAAVSLDFIYSAIVNREKGTTEFIPVSMSVHY